LAIDHLAVALTHLLEIFPFGSIRLFVIGLIDFVQEIPVPMTLDELLRSRILELVVHLDDLTCSVGVTELPVPPEAIVLTSHLGLDIDMQRYGREEVLRALFRRDRADVDALRPF